MNTKGILMSILMIGVVAMAAGAGTLAYFSDTEESTGNVFAAGTIDIAVDEQNPWMESFALEDLKPCEVDYIEFWIDNVGTNDAKIWKKLTVTGTSGGEAVYPPGNPVASSESEYEEGYVEGTGYVEKCDIDTVITYDLYVEIYNETGALVDSYVIIDAEDDVKISDVDGYYIYLGDLPAGYSMYVNQSYHMQPDVTNWAQGDTMSFDIELYAEQLGGPGPSPVWTST